MAKSLIYIHSTDLGSNDTSTSFVVYNALSLAERGVNVELLVMNSSSKNPVDLILEYTGLDSLPETLKVITHKTKGGSKFTFYFFVRSFIKRKAESSLVLISAHGVLPYIYFIKDNRHRYVFETHDFFYDLNIRDDSVPKTMNRKSRIERRYFKKLDGMICLNNHQQKLYKERIPEIEIEIFPTGIYKIPKLKKKRKNRVVYIGSLDWRLGTNRLINLIRNWPENIELVIIGGKTEKEINQFKQHLGDFADNIRITGWLSKPEMHDLLAESKVALMPHEDVFFSRYMTVPLKMFDYFTYGLPILATDLPTIRDWITEKENGFFVDWDNSEQTMNIIKDLLSDSNKWNQISEKILAKASSMLWSVRADNQVKYFESKNWI